MDSGDSSAITLGVNFTPTASGTITGLRFYKAAANSGTHVGSLWSRPGRCRLRHVHQRDRLGLADLTFATPVAITAGTTYVAGYLAPAGHYRSTGGGFTSGVDNGPLQANASSDHAATACSAYGRTSTFPTSTFNATNYWIDVLFQPSS